MTIKPLIDNGQFIFVYLSIFEAFFTFWYISFCIVCICIAPFIAHQIWCFFLPALYSFEAKMFSTILVLWFILILLGLYIGYFFIVPCIWYFFLKLGTDNIQYLTQLSKYIAIFVKIIMFSLCCFECPLLLVIFVQLNFVTVDFLIKKRFVFYSVLLLFSATVAPEFIIQFVAFFVFLILYEFSLFCLLFFKWYYKPSHIPNNMRRFL